MTAPNTWTAAAPAASSPAQRAAQLVDQLLVRARPATPLVEFLRAHLDAAAPGAARSFPEHLVDLLTLGVRWRLHARAQLRRAWARPDHDAVAGLLIRLRAAGVPAGEVARLNAWNEFAVAEGCPEMLDEAVDLAAWFEPAADALLGRSAAGLEAQLELCRAEVLSRALRERRPLAPIRPLPRLPLPPAAPRPSPAALAAESARRTLERLARGSRA
jgi:hypothetical protein